MDATRTGEAGRLGNPFPMGDGGKDERRRELVLDLHKRWLRAWDVPAADMRCAVALEGEPRWIPPPTLLRWSDLRGQRRHGSRHLACALVDAEAAEGSSGDEDGEERGSGRESWRRPSAA